MRYPNCVCWWCQLGLALFSLLALSGTFDDLISAISGLSFLCKFCCVWIKTKWKIFRFFSFGSCKQKNIVYSMIFFFGEANNIHLLSLLLIQPWSARHVISMWKNPCLFFPLEGCVRNGKHFFSRLNGKWMPTHCWSNNSLPFEMSLWIIKTFFFRMRLEAYEKYKHPKCSVAVHVKTATTNSWLSDRDKDDRRSD